MVTRPLLVCLCLAVSVATPGQVPIAITTDSAAYCAQLARRLSAQAVTVRMAAELQVTRLGVQGRALCAGGDVRGGIRRLREALLLAGSASPSPRSPAPGGLASAE
jgi:hypothetical protein